MLERLKYLPKIIDAKYVGNFTIDVEFDNGERKRINCHKYLKGKIFEELKDEEKFKEFFIDGYTVCWPNGADIAPETLYLEGENF
ncbi:DUF2442 domain-containing protein [Desulfothermus naphthae]